MVSQNRRSQERRFPFRRAKIPPLTIMVGAFVDRALLARIAACSMRRAGRAEIVVERRLANLMRGPINRRSS
jgi:hypothetical protein